MNLPDEWVPWQCPRCGKTARANLTRLGPLGVVRCTCGSTSRASRPIPPVPIRVCCGQRHHGPVCPDGLTMCCICFNRVPKERLALLEEGDGSSVESAPIYEDVCQTCRRREEQWGRAHE